MFQSDMTSFDQFHCFSYALLKIIYDIDPWSPKCKLCKATNL